MKNMKKMLSLVLVFCMMLGMVTTNAYAAEAGHTHDEDGWTCVWTEPVTEANCLHEHGEECYTSGAPVLNCGEAHHTESCYAPGEDVLTCEDGSEEHEHDASCYTAGESVLVCGETHHTEDCYVSGEDELNCVHECGEECVNVVAEGYWTCAAPEAKTEGETPAGDEGNNAEVLAFLDAVAALPSPDEVTPDNAEAIGEQVNAVLDMWDALSAEDSQREDVAEVLDAAYAVYAAVIEAEDVGNASTFDGIPEGTISGEEIIISTGGPSTFNFSTIGTVGNTTNYAGNLTKHVGEDGFFLRCPTKSISGDSSRGCGHLLSEYSPIGYSGVSASSTVVGIASFGVAVGTWGSGSFDGAECLKYTFVAEKPGVAKVTFDYYVNFLINVHTESCRLHWSIVTSSVPQDYTWHQYRDTMDLTVKAQYRLAYNTRGGSAIAATTEDATETLATLTVTSEVPTREGYDFKGWSTTNPDTAPAGTTVSSNVSAGSSITLDWESGKGNPSNPVSMTLYAIWEEVPTAPTREELHGILGDFVEVECVSTGDGLPHASKMYSTIGDQNDVTIGEVVPQSDGPYTCTLTFHGKTYAKFYGYEETVGTGEPHTLKEGEAETQTADLTWDAFHEVWTSGRAENTPLAIFKVVCGKPSPKQATYTVEWYVVGEDRPFKTDETRTGTVGQTVAVTEADKVVEGYTFAVDAQGNVLSTTLAESGTVLKLYFTKDAPTVPEQPMTFTVTWLNGYGGTIDSETYDKATEGEKYKDEYPTDPTRSGYTFTGWGDPVVVNDNGDLTITAQWREDSGSSDRPVNPNPNPTPTPTPTPPETPTTEVDDPDVPLSELPEEPEEPTVDIEDPEVPLTELPEVPTESDDPIVEIDDPDVPLADVPQTGDNSHIWMLITLLSGAGFVWLVLEDKKHKTTKE